MSKSIAEKWAARITNAVSKYEYTESETVYFIQQAIDEAVEAETESLQGKVDALTKVLCIYWGCGTLREFIASQKELPPEFSKLIEDNLEDLLLDDKPPSGENPYRCDSCERMYDLSELNTVDADQDGQHTTFEICDDCHQGKPPSGEDLTKREE